MNEARPAAADWRAYAAQSNQLCVRKAYDRFDTREIRRPAVVALLEVPRGSGIHTLRDNTLELNYADGRVARITTYVFPEELEKPVPEEIYIHAHDFRRVR